MSLNYLYLSEEFSAKSKMYNFITVAEKINLDYEMKMLREFSEENVTKISNSLEKYYEVALDNTKKIIYRLNLVLRGLE